MSKSQSIIHSRSQERVPGVPEPPLRDIAIANSREKILLEPPFKRDLQNIRGDIEKHCTDWYNMATTTARKADVEPSMPRVVGQQQHRSNVEAESLKEYYKRALTIPLLDHLISEMDSYFDPNNDAVMSSLLCVLPALLVSQEGNPVQAAIQYYADDLPSP